MSLRIDFYLLSDTDPKTIWHTACRLLEKAYHLGHRVFVHCENQSDAEFLDELLWTYKEESFVPHNLQGEGPEPPPPIQIGWEKEPRGFNTILLNLGKSVPPYFARFNRIMEIVANDEGAKEISRNHYKEYRTHGCELHTHPLEQSNQTN